MSGSWPWEEGGLRHTSWKKWKPNSVLKEGGGVNQTKGSKLLSSAQSRGAARPGS